MIQTSRPGAAVVRRELAIAALLVLVGGLVIALAWRIEPGVQTDPLGPRAFPLALGAGIGLCGLLLAAGALVFGGEAVGPGLLADAGEEDAEAGPFSPGRLVGAIAATALYVAAFDPLGYLLATPPYVAALLLIHGGTPRRTLWVAPLVITIAYYAAFRFGLLIPVPGGLLEPVLPW